MREMRDQPSSRHLRRSWVIAATGVILVTAAAWGGAAAARLVFAEDWEAEAADLAGVLGVRPDTVLAEIGAGRGGLTVAMARFVPDGRVYSTELDRDRLRDIEEAVADAGLRNVTVLEAGERDSRLPEGCCDAVFLREVYHHFRDAPAVARTIHRALKPGALLAVIDYPERGPGGSNCHCISRDEVTRQLEPLGFEPVSDRNNWHGGHYLAVYRRK
jgi:cyclopropane fatty-acyl-phospholipid synthase-like methyltransferase